MKEIISVSNQLANFMLQKFAIVIGMFQSLFFAVVVRGGGGGYCAAVAIILHHCCCR